MATSVIQTDFSSGELSINLYARVDLQKYHSGAALIRNFFVDYRGGVSSRTGTELIGQAKTNATVRVTRFQTSSTQSYVLEWSDKALRFITMGSYVSDLTAVATAATNAKPGVFTSTSALAVGDWVIASGFAGLNWPNGLSGINGRTLVVLSNSGTALTFADANGIPFDTTPMAAYTSGGQFQRIYTLATPYVEADIFALKFTQSADVLSIVHPNYPPYDLTRLTSSSFQFTQTVFASGVATPTGLTGTYSGTLPLSLNYGYTVTAVGPNGIEESLQSDYVVVAGNILGNANNITTLQWDSVPGATSYNVYKWGPTSAEGFATNVIDDTVFGFVNNSLTPNWSDYGAAPDFTKSPPLANDPFAPGAITSIQVTAGGTGAGGSNSFVGLTITGDGTGATAYAVADTTTGKIVGVVVINGGTGYTHATVTPARGTGATFACMFSPITGTYPSAVAYFQQRRAYAAPIVNPQQINFSQSGIYTNFNDSIIETDDQAIEISIASREVNQIQNMIAMPIGMIIITTDGAFLLSGGTPQAAITPANVVCLPQASPGGSALPALRINYNLLYVQARGATVRDMTFSFYTQSYYGFDRSTLANHLFFGFQLVDWDYAEEPFRLVLACRNDGQMLVMTYVPEQEIYGWSHWDTLGGKFNSICEVIEGQENAIYVVVNRYGVNYVERFASRDFQENVVNYWGVDAGLQATVTNATVVGGLYHLIGQTVTGLANGFVIPPTVVDETGSIQLPFPTTGIVTVGLVICMQLQTLYMDEGEPTIQGKRKEISGLTLRFDDTRGLEAGPTFDQTFPIKDLMVPYNTPAELVSTDIRMTLSQYVNTFGQICIQSHCPLPATVLGLVPEVSLGDTAR